MHIVVVLEDNIAELSCEDIETLSCDVACK